MKNPKKHPIDAWLQVEITHGDVIATSNLQAAEWAAKHGGEISGKFWPEIIEATRKRIGEIIKNAFEKKTPFSVLVGEIQKAGVPSEDLAASIANAEISSAQVNANFEAFKKTGLVSKIKWLAVGREPCPTCKENNGKVRTIGEKFPSGDAIPPAHPDCYCILMTVSEK